MAYVSIAKLKKFISEENDAQAWLNDVAKAITANNWNDDKALQAIPYFLQDTIDLYFSNNNSINHLVNTFTTIKQGDTEAVITYLGRFHRCLCQIQAINTDYFTVAQILNQFIKGLCSSILQCVHPLHPADLQAAIINTRDFEAAKLEANHAQAVNLVMNGSSELDSKLKQFTIYQPPQQHNNQGNFNHVQNQPCSLFLANQQWQQETCVSHYCVPSSEFPAKSRTIPTLTSLCTNNAAINLSTTSILSSNLSTAAISNLSTTTAANNLSTPTNSNTAPKLTTQWNTKTKNNSTELEISNSGPSTNPQFFTATIWITPNLNSQNYLSLLITLEDTSANNLTFTQKQPLTSNIPPATITKDESLAAIFPFEFEKTTATPLFSGAALEAKLITTMYTDAKVERQSIKLILDSAVSARIITTDGVTKTPISEIDDFPFEINGIVTPIKVLVIKATQYQALLAFNGQHAHVPVMCSHFKAPSKEQPLIELEEEEKKPIWEAYQVSWADVDHNELLPILSWDDKGKKKEEKKLVWKLNLRAWSDDSQSKPTAEWSWEEKGKGKEQEKEPTLANESTYVPYSCQPPYVSIVAKNCHQWAHIATKMRNNILERGGASLRRLEKYPHNEDEIWRMAYAMLEDATTEELREIKNNSLSLPEPEYVQTFNAFSDIEDDPEKFHEHYQQLASTKKEQKQCLEEINT
ncbi:hypothetical protein G9A89_015627 [Geosiphon pyriformis]|nr:hypothetical protein G9A89_015627 [Geosiphon pyriformis]